MLPYIPESCRFLEGFRFAEESHRLWRSLESSSHARADRSCPAPPQNLPLVACEENPPCRSCRPPPQDRLAGQTHRGAPDLVHDPAAGYERGLPLPARKPQVPLRSLLAPEGSRQDNSFKLTSSCMPATLTAPKPERGPQAPHGIPPLQSGDHLSAREFILRDRVLSIFALG